MRDPRCDAEHQKPPLGECTCDAYTRGFFEGGGCVCKFNNGYFAAIKQVMDVIKEIHKPTVKEPDFCAGCMENSCGEYETYYPCETVLAIESLAKEECKFIQVDTTYMPAEQYDAMMKALEGEA